MITLTIDSHAQINSAASTVFLMRLATSRWILIPIGGLLLCSIGLNGWLLYQIYAPAGWRDELGFRAETFAVIDAAEDFRKGERKLYILNKYTQVRRYTGTNDGPFEIWLLPNYPDLSSATKFADEQYAAAYNRKMRHWNADPEQILKSKPEGKRE